MKNFEENLEKGKYFEKKIKPYLDLLNSDYIVRDTSDKHRVMGRKYPDFEVMRDGKIKLLIDAKYKKSYYKEGKWYLPVSIDFINDYIFHADRLGVPCAIVFGVSSESRKHKGKIFFVKNIKKVPHLLVPQNNEHGTEISCWYDISKLIPCDYVLMDPHIL